MIEQLKQWEKLPAEKFVLWKKFWQERVKDTVAFNRPVLTIEKILCPTLKQNEIVIMDNLSSHKVTGVKELIESVGAKVKYFPSYSPDFNPIELLWDKMKSYLRKWKIRFKEKLPESISSAMSLVRSADCLSWISHCGYLIHI